MSSWANAAADGIASGWNAAKDFGKNVWSGISDGASNLWNSTKETAAEVADGVTGAVGAAAGYVDSVVNKLSGKQAETQLAVYKAFLNAGFSKNQALALTAEVGRENDYNANAVWGGHTDAAKDKNGNSISNLGFISWNRERRAKLIERARAAGVLAGPNQITQNQAGIS